MLDISKLADLPEAQQYSLRIYANMLQFHSSLLMKKEHNLQKKQDARQLRTCILV